KKQRMAIGMLDHSAGVAVACGAKLVVLHPGFLLGRTREDALVAVVEQLAELRERLEAKGRAVPFGVEVMGRVRELGTAEDVFAIATELPWVRPVIDFAHLHAVTDGAFTDVDAFSAVLAAADSLLEPGAPFHVHFSDIAFANRNETKHLSYGEGTLRAEPLAAALRKFQRPATVISESPDEASSQAIRSLVLAAPVAQELLEPPQDPDLEAAEARGADELERLDQQLLGLLVLPLRRADEPERHRRRRSRAEVVLADGLDRLERKPLRLVEAARADQHLRERTLALAERTAILERLQELDRLPQATLRLGVVSAQLGRPGERVQRASHHPGIADLGEEVLRLFELLLAELGLAALEPERA